MKKTIIVFIVLLGFYSFLSAKTVTENNANKVAINWLNSHKVQNVNYKIVQHFIYTSNTDTLFYIFNTNPSGYIIVSGDDITIPVIGYSFIGNFSNANLPPALKDWLELRKEEILQAKADSLESSRESISLWNLYLNNGNPQTDQTRDVSPLLQTTWDQPCYYNESCPEDVNGPCGHAVTGCVATAMAQIMKYWEYPGNGLGEHEYLDDDYGWIYANFLKTVYDWDQMPNKVTTNNEPTATIMFHSGVSVDMDYSANSSGACSKRAKSAFITYFGYSDTISLSYKSNFSDEDWKTILKSDLNNNWPVYISVRLFLKSVLVTY